MKTILVVEDELPILKMVKVILAAADYGVLCASSANHALQLASLYKSPIDLLLADVMLSPGMLGTELAVRLKRSHPAMRVILMSGKPGGNLAVLQGGWQFLAKPFMREQLLAKIRAELETKGAAGG